MESTNTNDTDTPTATCTRRSFASLVGSCLIPLNTMQTTDPYTDQLDLQPVYYQSDETRTRITPSYIFDRIRWGEAWSASLDDPTALTTYQSDGYLVVVNVTPQSNDLDVLSVDDLAFETAGIGNSEPTLLRERLPDAGMFVHPTEDLPLVEPSDEMDYHVPSGVVVEVAPDDWTLTYGVEAGDGMVGRTLSLPELTAEETER